MICSNTSNASVEARLLKTFWKKFSLLFLFLQLYFTRIANWRSGTTYLMFLPLSSLQQDSIKYSKKGLVFEIAVFKN